MGVYDRGTSERNNIRDLKQTDAAAKRRRSHSNLHSINVIGIRPLAPVQNSVSGKLIQRKTLNFVINLPDVENITK